MTREEVIIHLKGIKSYIKGGYMTEPEKREVEALNMAIEALDQEPFINKPCVSSGVCEHDKNKVLDKYIKEIDHLHKYISKLETQIVMQEPCEDCISREHLLEEIASLKESPWFKDDTNCAMAIRKEAIEIVEDLCIRKEPSVNPQKIGHWIYDRTRDWDGECKYECSECGMGSDVDYAYCMRCGAKMIEQQEREE